MSDDRHVPGAGRPAPLLDEHLCFTLYAASRAVTGAYRPLLDPLGLTYPQYLVLVALGEHGTATVKELVAALQLDYGTVTPLIKRLEANGLLKRERRADDERVVEVALTPQGVTVHQHIASVPPAIGEAMGLTPEEIATTQELVRRITVNVNRHNAGVQPAEPA
ncbi:MULTISPECIES: MarR family winged helix-turn-helix transcriptional regulator [unclassified Streptomyces]|uniref:MarR family winged helix-turn-helix transcriptional regulator n=1 Tax=unclassified Streptomyces TaxID=2593676 RepID=UPI00380D183A